MNARFIRVCAVIAAVIVSGCGGGGGGGGTTSAGGGGTTSAGGGGTTSGGGGGTTTPPRAGTTTFPFQKAFATLIGLGSNDNFTVTGTCTGTANITVTTGTQIDLQTIPGFSPTQLLGFPTSTQQTLTLSSCARTSVVFSTTYYQTATFQPIGYTINGTEWDKYQTLPQGMPATVAVGDAAILSTLTVYKDSGYTITNGTRVVSYEVLPDGTSTSTALVNYTTTVLDTANNPLYTEQDQYRIDTDANAHLELLSIKLKDSSGEIVLTKI